MIPLAFLERVSRQKFTHVGLTGVDCRRIMHDTVHDSVRDYAASKAGMPFTGFVLRTKDRWPLIISALKDLQQIFVLLLGRNIEQPLVDNEEVIIREFCHNTGNTVGGCHCQIKHFKHFRHPYISGAVQMAARFLTESTGQMRFSRAGKTVDDNVMAGVDKGARSKSQYRVSIQTSVLIVHRVDICLRITKFGVTEKPFCPV
jgi:hypothetical protein